MDIVARIRQLGFRKWYERELIRSHAALVTCFLCGLTVAALLEGVSFREFGVRPLTMLAVVFFAVLVGWTSWRSYVSILQRAERYGERSSCPGCKAYARFNILSTGEDEAVQPAVEPAPALVAPWLRVQCRRCGTAWRMPE